MFITLEGPEGSGKSSQISLLVEFLRDQGYAVVQTREPGGTSIGDQIRATLLTLENPEMHPRTEALLLQASRAQHVEEIILPQLRRGKLVICDRFADSTLAYQGYGHQNDLDALREIIHYATGGLEPDLTILLDLDVEVGLQRRMDAGNANRLDTYTLEFHKRVMEGYRELARQDPRRWIVIAADRSPREVQSDLRNIILRHLTDSGKRG